MIDLDEQISANFNMRELLHSETATAKMWVNVCGHEEADNLRYLVREVLQPLRDHLGTKRVVRSGYRTKALNKAVGGAPNSFHTRGCAADLKMPNWETAFKAAAFVTANLPFSEVILSCKGLSIWLHVACDRGSEKKYVGFKKY